MNEDTVIKSGDLDSITNDKVREVVDSAINRSRSSRAVGANHRSGHRSVLINQHPDPDQDDSNSSENP